MNPYNQGFDHGIDFVLNQIEGIQERTKSKDILKLLMILRGEQIKSSRNTVAKGVDTKEAVPNGSVA